MLDPGPVRDVLTVLLGIATGALSGLFGVGGATISTPGIRALGVDALTAVGTTLPSIIPGAASGTARYARERLIVWRAVAATAPFGIVAAVGGSLMSERVPGEGHLLQLATATLLGYSALRMARGTRGAEARAATPPDPEAGPIDPGAAPDVGRVAAPRSPPEPPLASPGRYAAVGVLAGSLSGLLGIGGGIVMVPGFTQLTGMTVKQAIGTSLACVGLFAIPGTITHGLLGNIDWRFALLLTVGVVPGARLGAAAAIRVDDRRLRGIVAGFLGLTALLYAAGELAALAR